MKKYDEMFKKEQQKIEIIQQLAQNEKQAKAEIILDFCNSTLFEFLEYLNDKFYVRKHGVNYNIDRAIYKNEMVYRFSREKAIESIKNNCQFRTGIQYKWSNGSLYDTLRVDLVDFKPVLTYEGKKMDTYTFIEIAVSQIQAAINRNSEGFQIIEKI